MDICNSSDSEFDSDAEEAECRLYTQLYFGEENCKELQSIRNKKNSRSPAHKSPNYVDVGRESRIETNYNLKSDDYIDNDICLSRNSNLVRNCTTANKTGNVISYDDALVQLDSVNKFTLLKKNISQEKVINTCSRSRNISICSTDSISGKEPLDNLYCNYGDLEVSSLNDCLRSSLEPIAEIYSSNCEDTGCCSSEEESRYCIKSSKSKHLNKKSSTKVSDSGSSTEDEICILPPDPPKFVETLTLDSTDTTSSEESIKIVLNTPPVKNNGKRKNTAKTKIAKKKLNRIASPIFLSSEDSEDSECEFLEAASSPMTSLTINVRQDKCNRSTTFSQNNLPADRNVGLISFVKSQVIFSKTRPLTKREPGCSKWTIEMSSLYDSDISEDFDVESIHASQSDDIKKWKIISEDYNVRPQNRYFNKQVRCFRCKEFGHHISKCSKIPHCLYCGSANHIHISQCPDNCCLRCGEGVHGYCHLTNNVMICVLCNQAGHHAKLCPDIWRRFYSTTKGTIPVKPKRVKRRKETRIAYCYNCGKKGHYGHECGSNNYKKYSLVAADAISYSPVDDVLDNLSFYRPGPNGQISESCPDNEGEKSLTGTTMANQERNYMGHRVEENNQRIFRMKSSRTADIMSKIKYVKKEIRARSGACVLYTLRPTKKYWKVIISGNNKSVQEAEKIMNILLGKIPAYEYTQYNDLYSKVKDWNNLPREIASILPTNSLHLNQGMVTPRHRFTPSRKSYPLHDSTPSIKDSGSRNLKDSNKLLINSDGVIKTTPKSSKSKKLLKKSLSPVTNENSLLEFAKKRTTSKGKNSLNNSFIQSKKNSVISPGHKKVLPFNGSIDKVFNDKAMLNATPDARIKINELRQFRESVQLSKSICNSPDIITINVGSSSKKKSKKSSGKGPIGGRVLVKTIPDAREIIQLKKESKVRIDNYSKVIPSLSKFFVATSDLFETSKKKIKKTTKNTGIKISKKMTSSRLVQLLCIPLMTSAFIAGSSIYNDQTVEILELDVPLFPKAGEDATLTCRFRLGGTKHRLYTVNWWRGKDQFYTYKKNSYQPKNAYKFSGIDVRLQDSTEESVVLQNVNEDTSGVYKCEVMGEGPAFRTAVETMEMRVIVPPERIEITHTAGRDSHYQYQADDVIQLNCTALRVKPRPALVWRINGQEAKRGEVQRYPDFEDHRGRVTSTLGLHFMAQKYFINRVAKVTCTAYVEGHEFMEEQEVQLDPSAAFDLYSSGGWKKTIAWQVVCVPLFIGRTWIL